MVIDGTTAVDRQNLWVAFVPVLYTRTEERILFPGYTVHAYLLYFVEKLLSVCCVIFQDVARGLRLWEEQEDEKRVGRL